MDRTIINLFSLLLTFGGLFAFLAEYDAPELQMSFYGANPFARKADVSRGTLAWVFGLLALLTIVLQLLAEIMGGALPARLHGTEAYVIVSAVGAAIVAVTIWVLVRLGRWIARRRWTPEVIKSQRSLFEGAQEILENDGWHTEDLERKDNLTGPDRERRRSSNLASAEKNIAQIERLIEIEDTGQELIDRVKLLEPYFAEG